MGKTCYRHSEKGLCMTNKITIRDIAHLAGVSTTTVSRVLNNKPDVDPATRERILQLIAEHDFVPSVTASGLAGRSRLIGVLVPSFDWPFVPEIMSGIAKGMKDTPYELILYSVNEATREHDESTVIDRILTTQLTAAVLAVFPGHLSRQIIRLHKHNFPVVVIDDQEQVPVVPWVGAENENGAYMAVRHLLQKGHRRIAHIQGPMKYLCSRERHDGYCRALREQGIEIDPQLSIEGDFLEGTGYQAAQTLFSLPPEQRPTAIFASSDMMAYGVLSAARARGLRVPRDLALIGFDDIRSSSLIRPALTTVRQPFFEMGQQGIKVLLSTLNTVQNAQWPPTTKPQQETGYVRIQLATHLIVRESCGSGIPYAGDGSVSTSITS
jgi:LacI family transcriptional regulator